MLWVFGQHPESCSVTGLPKTLSSEVAAGKKEREGLLTSKSQQEAVPWGCRMQPDPKAGPQ